LPERVNSRLARFFNDLGKARIFDFEQFHVSKECRKYGM
jgi:hypothetical protein